VLLLGGTTEASELTRQLARRTPPIDLTVSFAGRTAERAPLPSKVAVRVGGFGGIAGLTDYVASERFDAVVDATHPFAARMPFHVSAACETLGVPMLRLIRPPWVSTSADRWIHAPDMASAARAVVRSAARRVFLTVGRQELSAFAACRDVTFLVRSIEPPSAWPGAEVILARGPFSVADERQVMTSRRIDLIVSKNSGGEATGAKIEAARQLSLPVVMVDRPAAPAGPSVATVEDAIGWLTRLLDQQKAH